MKTKGKSHTEFNKIKEVDLDNDLRPKHDLDKTPSVVCYDKGAVRFNTPSPVIVKDHASSNRDKNNLDDINYVHAYSIKQRLILPENSIEMEEFD